MVEAKLQQAPIAVTEFLEGLFETLLKSYERIAAWGTHFVFISAQQVLGHRRDDRPGKQVRDRKSTPLNSSHQIIPYAVFCFKKKQPFSPHLHIYILHQNPA